MKKIIAAAAAAALFTAQSVYAAGFTDIEGHWAESTIRSLSDKGIINGISETEFLPDGQVTRAQYLKMIMETTGVSAETFRDGECLDVQSGDWFAPYVQGALDKGLIPRYMVTGYKASVREETDEEGNTVSAVTFSGAFNGNLPITREEMAYLSASMYQYILNASTMKSMEEVKELDFTDVDKISGWAVYGVEMAVANHFIEGMEDNSFAPSEHTTRAQAAVVTERIMNKIGK